jgi:hypothetical protein
MKRKLSSDARDSLFLALGVGGFFALMFIGMRFLPTTDHALWKNIFLWSSAQSSDWIFFNLVIFVANGINNAKGQPPRPWLGILFLLIGVAGILMLATTATVLLPRVDVMNSLVIAVVGLTVAMFFVEGVPAQVWRNLFVRNVDYASRFFPMAGTLVCVFVLGLWARELFNSWMAHDYVCVTDMASFVVGFASEVVTGKRRQKPITSAVIA